MREWLCCGQGARLSAAGPGCSWHVSSHASLDRISASWAPLAVLMAWVLLCPNSGIGHVWRAGKGSLGTPLLALPHLPIIPISKALSPFFTGPCNRCCLCTTATRTTLQQVHAAAAGQPGSSPTSSGQRLACEDADAGARLPVPDADGLVVGG